jgi:hypothetical protein
LEGRTVAKQYAININEWPLSRRQALSIALGFAVPAAALSQGQATKVVVDTTGVHTFKQLVAALKSAAGTRAPTHVRLAEVYRACAEAFVEHGQEALALGKRIPGDIADRLPRFRRSALPILVLIPLWGLVFAVPLATFFEAALTSVALLLVVRQVLREKAESRKRV